MVTLNRTADMASDAVLSSRRFTPVLPPIEATYGFTEEELQGAVQLAPACSVGNGIASMSEFSILDDVREGEMSLQDMMSQDSHPQGSIHTAHTTRFTHQCPSPTSWLKAKVREIHAEESVQQLTAEATTSTLQQPTVGAATSTMQYQHDAAAPLTIQHQTSDTKHKHWTKKEDEILRNAVKSEGLNSDGIWGRVSQNYFRGLRNPAQCKSRWKKVSHVCRR